MIRAVIFEPEGTLFPAGYGGGAFFRAQARRWVDATAGDRQNEAELAKRLRQLRGEPGFELGEFYARIVREFGLPLRAAGVLRREYEEGWSRAAQPLEGAELLLSRLARRGHRLGLVAEDGGCEQARRLENAGWGERFDTVFTTDARGRGRVDKDLLGRAVRCLGVAPDEAAFVAAKRGLALVAARAAGLYTVWIGNDSSGGAAPAALADLRLSRLDELTDALEMLALSRPVS